MSIIFPPWGPYVAGAAIVLGLGAGGYWLRSSGYEAGQIACEAAHTVADLNEFKSQTTRVAGIADTLAAGLDDLKNAQPTVIKEYHETIVKAPLPAGCVIDAGRLRSINAAIAAAAAAGAKRGSTVPTGPAVQ